MRVQWVVPGLPTTAFSSGEHELLFSGTVGWCWEEATWAGQFTGCNDQLLIGPDIEAPDAVVISPEGAMAQYAQLLQAAPKEMALFLRCVGAPGLRYGLPTDEPPNDTWKAIEPLVPRLRGIAVLSEIERRPLERWARGLGYRGEVCTIPLGAVVASPPNSSARSGVAFLGRPFVKEKGIDLLVAAAKRLPKIPFYFSAPRGTELELTLALQHQLKDVPNAQVITCGIRGREALLCKVRIAAVWGATDWQWLPGTEIRGAMGIALAGKGTPIEAWNGDGLAYYRDLDDLVEQILDFHRSDELYRRPWDSSFIRESNRQHTAFHNRRMSSQDVGRALWNWVRGGMATP